MENAGQSFTASRRILLVNPPSPAGLTANREGAGGLGAWSPGYAGFIYPPQTLATTAAVLRLAGWHVRLVDAAGERINTEAALQRVKAQPETLIAILIAQLSLENDLAFVNSLRVAVPQARLIAIGTSMPFIEAQILERTDVDHVAIGEPEGILLPLCQVLIGESFVRRVRRSVTAADVNASNLDQFGRLKDLNALPFPAWDLVPWQQYGFLTISTSRGCDDTCTFCPYVVGQGRKLRSRHPQQVADEMAWLATTFHPARVIIRDPVFACDRQRVEAICRELITHRVNLAWECESRPEHFSEPLLRLMQQAGCTTIKIGLETTSERVLRTLWRIPPHGSAHAYMERTASIVATCHDLGMACRVFVMTGLPGQTDEDVNRTIAFLHKIKPTVVHVKPFHRYPGLAIPLADAVEERRRGEQQAHMIREAFPRQAPPASSNPLRRARRWLARRILQ